MHSIDRHATDVLLLLIGANPLPNYVAAQLLTKPGATVYLLHTEGENGPQTKYIAERLEVLLQDIHEPRLKIILRGLADSDDILITNTIDNICKEIQRRNREASIGLNYAGGTKPMAVHTYRTIARNFPDAVFSYLDPRQLTLRIDRSGSVAQQSYFILKDPELRQRTQLTLIKLAALHGYTLKPKVAHKHDPALLNALAQVHSQKDSFDEWKKWLKTKSPWQLPTRADYPLLKPVIAVFATLYANSSQSPEVAVAQHICGTYTALDSCRKWFIGEWLEEYVLDALDKQVGNIIFEKTQCEFLPQSTNHIPKNSS